MGGSLEPSDEGDRERVQRGLPPHHPACPPAASGVKRPRHEVKALERGLLVREVSACLHGPAVSRVDGLDRVGRADHPADLDIALQERHELRPRAAPELHDRRITITPLDGELREPVLHRLLGRGRVNRLERFHWRPGAAGRHNGTSCGSGARCTAARPSAPRRYWIASGSPFNPSQTAISTSSTPRFFTSANTCSQNLAPSAPSPA